jgi:hypothetical protein
MWHRNAIGYAVNVGEDSIDIGYDEKQDTSWSRATIFHGAKILQNTGIVQLKHDVDVCQTATPKYKRYQVLSTSGATATLQAPTAIT